MEGAEGIRNSLRCLSIFVLLTGITSEYSLLPGPVIYVKNNSNVTFKCSSTVSWNLLNFFDSAMVNDNLAVLIFQANSTHCRSVFIDDRFGADKYSALPCTVGQPISIIVRYINASYHNKLISCVFDNKPSSTGRTTIKIREDLTSPTINPNGNVTIKENVYTNFTCTADSIPKSSIVWYMDGSLLTDPITTSNPTERRLISTITYQAKKEHDNKNVYCSASNMYTSLNSTFTKLNIIYVPIVLMNPRYDSYKLYVGQTNVNLTCLVVKAKPLDGISYYWNNPGGKADGPTVIITDVLVTDEGEYRCIATNLAGNSSVSTKQIIVQYIPQITLISDTSIKEGNPLVVHPTVDAKPAPLSIWWTKKNNDSFRHEGKTLSFNDIRREATGQYTCHALNVLTPSGMETMNKTSESSITIDVLYIPEIHTEPDYDPYILYHKQQNVVLKCVVDEANPTDDITYNWSSPNGSMGKQNFTITTVEKWHTGEYSCKATNIAGPSNAGKIQILVQYKPVITNIADMTVVEGQRLVVTPHVDAKPDPLSVWWTRENDSSFRHNGETLTINNTQRGATGQYTCHAMNVLIPSGVQTMDETSEMSIYVDVLYTPEIHTEPNFNTYVLYHKQQNVVLTCLVDHANPSADIIYQWITPNGISKNQNVTISTVEKSHGGEYACTASNTAGTSNASTLQISVQYGPLISNIAMQINIVEGNNLKVSPIVDANPLPQFVWWIKQNSTAIIYDMYNLTIHNIQRFATGNYIYYVMNTIEPSGLDAMNMTANWTMFINVQYPPSTEITEAPSIDVLENNTVTLHCKVTDANPIMSSIVWYKYGIKTLETMTNYTINKILRSDAGEYICEAKNTIGNGTTSVNINVLYAPAIKSLKVSNGSTALENSSVLLECEVESNPASYIEWTFNDELLQNNGFTAGRSYYTITRATCFQTGIYSCTATNSIYEQEYNDSKEVELFVNCSPRLNSNMARPPNKIGLPLGGNLNISVYIIAYPVITASKWIFRPNITENVSYNINTDLESKSFRHTIKLFKPNLTETDFGDYSLAVQNSAGSTDYTFHVVPEGPPEPSAMINATCGIQTVLVYWVTSFSGGDSQNFSVIVIGESKDKYFKTNVVSNAKGEIQHTSLNLSPGDYTFSILGENKYDSALSLNTLSCQVKDYPKTATKSVVAAAAGGGVGAAAILVGVVFLTLVILKKRRIVKKGKQFKEGRKKLTDEDTEEGLKDNPLYATSQETKDDSGPMYSIVNKSEKSEKCNDDGPVYSHVQKKTSKGTPDKDGKSLKKMKPSRSDKMDIEMGSVYENSDKIMSSKEYDEIYANSERNNAPNQSQIESNNHHKKNKDGLIYADLDLAPSGKRFVIRGIENRNNYAIIDLSKTAEPLPSDDEDVGEGRQETDSTTINDK